MWSVLGRKFLNTESKPNFFSSGIITASFQLRGNIPESNEMLIVFIITGIRGSVQDFRGVGIGSSQQDVDLEFVISMRTSSSVSGVNFS